MKKITIVRSFLAAGLIASSIGTASAGDMYGGLSYAALKSDTGVGGVKPSVVYGSLGYMVNKNLAVEGRLGSGASDDTITTAGGPVTLKVNHYYGAYLKAIAVNGDFSVYGIAGWSGAKATASGGGVSVSDSETSGSFGIGMSAAVGKNAEFTAEWARIFKDTDGISLGMSFKF